MYARMTQAQPRADDFDQAVNLVETVFMAAAREQHGYKGFLLLTDRDAQSVVGISLWETEQDLENSSSSSGYYQKGIATFAETLASPPDTSTFRVSLHDA